MPENSMNLSIKEQLSHQVPFSLLPTKILESWLDKARLLRLSPGQKLLRSDELNAFIYLVLQGHVRLVVFGGESEGQFTLSRRGPGQLLGWVSLLRSSPTELVLASTDLTVLALTADDFILYLSQYPDFNIYFRTLTNAQESYTVAVASAHLEPKRPANWREDLLERIQEARATSFLPGESYSTLPILPSDWRWYLSTSGLSGFPSGTALNPDNMPLEAIKGFNLHYRAVALKNGLLDLHSKPTVVPDTIAPDHHTFIPTDLYSLGILEDDLIEDDSRFPTVLGRGPQREATAVCEMITIVHKVPFRRDSVQKVLEDQFRRDKKLSLELIGGLLELLGMTCELAEISSQHLTSLEAPAILFLNEVPIVYYGLRKGQVIISHPHFGIQRISSTELQGQLGDKVRFLLPRRLISTPTSRFGWNWFTPLLKKYKKALLLVFISSLMAQMFGLAIPLLLQQIIDKVLSQGNLSSLNVLGSTMIVMALFQGCLQALRTYIFVDTTDRMDLTLGSAVIDRLLALPLKYFEKRPVGELSQRLGELNTIRGFLTGTALISLLNIIFAFVYLVVMFIYSPLLTAVSLSTLPLYLILVFGVAPLYKSLIRKRAIASARTQSHLIEVIGGIQTVKAQNFELTARWKWQDRYREFVTEGFKSVALGATSSEIGNFLNQVSGLLVLWVGMWMVLKGQFTLGQLIAFRIIAGNVTSPLLQLASLYQGFQGVQLSMERLSDIIDQQSEYNKYDELGQIFLPPIHGSVRFENVKFRFGSNGPYQLDDVSVEIPSGAFVGIVGQSGSGKSTLMKLLPRLYDPQRGRIYIDDYDISKVDLASIRRQVGIVPQDSLLFEGTISENIALNDPQSTTEAIIEAAKLACAHEFIMTLSSGYATPIAERGGNLSGGQRQRIAIARTILSNPRLMVLDEATSALDYDTENQLCRNLQSWSHGRTVFFITHRLSTIRNSSVILVMHRGRLVESGNHSELMAINGRYAALYRQQQSISS